MNQRSSQPRTLPARSLRAGLAAGARVLAAALAVLLSIGGAPARSLALFRCVYTDVALTSCCCRGHESAGEAAELARGSCCEAEPVDASLPAGSPGPERVAASIEAPPLSALSALSALLPAPRIAYAPPALRPLRHAVQTRAGPSLIIVHRRLLL